MWPFFILYGALALPSLAQVYQSVTIRTLIPPGDYVGLGTFIAGQIENVYGFVQYCDSCEGTSPHHTPWMLLTSLSRVSLETKLRIAIERKAVAVIVIADNLMENVLQSNYIIMKSVLERKYGPGTVNMPVILVTKENAEKIIGISQIGGSVPVILEATKQQSYHRNSIMLIAVVSLIVTMVLGICYAMYVKKDDVPPIIRVCPYQLAVSKIPTQELTDVQDPVCDDEMKCAICLEGFQVKEVISHLPCKHVFHKDCIDPWLMERRLCPMCKMDVVKFYGPVNLGSEESIVDMPLDDRISVNSVASVSTAVDDEESSD